MIQSCLVVNAFIEPREVAGDSQIVLSASYDGHVVHAIPWSDGLTGDVVGREMLMHVLHKPVFDQPAQRIRIEQCKAQ